MTTLRRVLSTLALLALAVALGGIALLSAPLAFGQVSGLTWKAPVTANHCTEWLKPGVIEDAGAACGTSSMVYPGAGLAVSTGTSWSTSITLGSGMSTFLTLTWPSLVSGDCLTNNGSALSWGTCGSGGSPAFSSITSGTNTTAAMLVGTGASLQFTGSGEINSNYLMNYGLPTLATGYLEWTGSAWAFGSPSGSGITQLTGDVTAGPGSGSQAATVVGVNGASIPASEPCLGSNSSSQLIACTTTTTLPWNDITAAANGNALTMGSGGSLHYSSGIIDANYLLTDALPALSTGYLEWTGSAWAFGTPGGSSAFSALTGGTNTSAAMLVGTGASLGPTGSGTINANEVNGATVPASATIAATNSSNQIIAASTVTYLIDTGTTFTLGTGTGACATTSSLAGGSAVGKFECTGTSGASTIIINLPTAVNGWVCEGNDLTTTTDTVHQTASSTTSCTMSGTLVADDVINFMALGY